MMRPGSILTYVLAVHLAGVAVVAQTSAPASPPASDIWIASLTVSGDTVTVRRVVNATARPGYDNQPCFLPGGQSLLYTSYRGTQTDIYELTLDPHGERQVTDTRESEYSPTLMPDGTGVSVIRVESDNRQRLWRFSLDGKGDPSLLLTDVMPVGYHAWGDVSTVALFVLGQPSTLQIASTATQRAETLARDIGRSIHAMPGKQAFSFTERAGERQFTLKKIGIASHAIESLVALPTGAQDYAWMPNGMAITASGDRLLVWRDGWAEWRDAVFTKPAGMGAISRIAVSPAGDRLAIVAEEKP